MIAAEMARRETRSPESSWAVALTYQLAQPGTSSLGVPMLLSNGTRDQIAPADKAAVVKASMETSGFPNVRLEQHEAIIA